MCSHRGIKTTSRGKIITNNALSQKEITNDWLIFSGLQAIRKWTKESLLEKPFSTAKGKIWTETPSNTPLDEIYTKLCLLKKTRSKDTVKTEELSEFTQLLIQENDGPVRILATGIYIYV